MIDKPTLKQAQQDPIAMEQFIADHEQDVIEDTNFNKVVGSMMSGAGKPSKGQATSPKGRYGDCK